MPWCPKCKTEYREGFRVCADCGSELVEKLAEETADEEFDEPAELEAGNLFDEESLENPEEMGQPDQEEALSEDDSVEEGEILTAAREMPAGGEQEGCIKTAQSGPATTGRRPGCCWGWEQWG